MDDKRVFDHYLTNHYSNTEKTNFRDISQVLKLLEKNRVPLDLNLREIFKKKVRRDAKILDLGCGYGSFLYFLKSLEYKNVTGVDISTEELDICRNLFADYSFQQRDIHEYISVVNQKFDVIYLSHVLEHIQKADLFTFLEGIRDLLAEDGMFIVVVPNGAAYFNATAGRYGDISHEIGFTELSLNQVLTITGFQKIAIRNFYGVGNLWLNIVRKVGLFFFELFIQILGYEKQRVFTPSILVVAKK